MGEIMKKIIENCGLVPGVSLKNNLNSSELFLDRPDGHGKMSFYTLLPGLTLAFIDIYAAKWPESNRNAVLRPLLINYCVSGRGELLLDDGTYIYLREKDFSVGRQTTQKEYIFPTARYEGMKIYIDPEILWEACAPMLKALDIDLPRLEKSWCSKRKTYINEADVPLYEIFGKLWELRNSPLIFKMKIYLLELFYELLHLEVRPPRACSFYTEVQIEIAKKARQLFISDLKKHYPIRLAAEQFSVSETSLKNYFRGVYGQNISSYMRKVRMKKAAEMLAETKRPIAEIAVQVGYSNQGKFAAVFKKQFKMKPLEYRRMKRLEKAGGNM